jgi:hypothetical protein
MECFGPIQRNAVVQEAILGATVRETAIQAHRECLKLISVQFPQAENFKARSKEIEAMRNRHRTTPNLAFFILGNNYYDSERTE